MTKTIEAIWQLLQQHQGEIFHTAKGLPFTYSIRGGELFVNRRRKSITVSTVLPFSHKSFLISRPSR